MARRTEPGDDPFGQPRRWLVLGSYALVVGMSQLLWLNFAPLLSMIEQRYGVSELAASSLLLVFPLLYVIFSLPAGALTDARGYRFTVGVGTAAMVLFSALRIFDSSFWVLLAAQVGLAVAQPYVVNPISKLVADWFSEKQGAIATGLGTMGMFIGMAVAMATTPAMVSAWGLRATMAVFAAVMVVVALLFALFCHPNPRQPPQASTANEPRLGVLVRDRELRLLCILSALGLGVFNGLTTWIEPIVAPHGIDAEHAGLLGGMLIVAGIVGSVVVPGLSDVTRRRKPFLVLCAAAALVTVYPLCTSGRFGLALAMAGLHGFFFLPAFALLLEMSTNIAGAAAAGAATSLILLTGNAGGVLVIVAMPLVKGGGTDFHRAVLLMVALLGATTLLALRAPETFGRQDAKRGP
jgi:predicted MFS family arabinose efflux permease